LKNPVWVGCEHEKGEDDHVTMKITGVLVDVLAKLDPELYGPYIVFEMEERFSLRVILIG